MTRKPDGYVPLLEDGSFNIDLLDDGAHAIPVHLEKSNVFKPVCIVPPELLDWVEEVRDHLSFIDSIGDDGSAEYLLKELNKIWPEDKSRNED